jgi:hypothetical protein
MTQCIIYNQDNGVVAVIIPSPEALEQHGIQAIAMKDVPAGKKFKIVDAADIPSDRTFRNAWEADEDDLTDGVGGEHDMFITDPQHNAVDRAFNGVSIHGDLA